MNKPFQRKGSVSNTRVGQDYELKVMAYLSRQNISLDRPFPLKIGINGKKFHPFDLGSKVSKVLVECKSHTWTETDNVPSAKLISWDQTMYLFYASPKGYRKLFVVLRSWSTKREETLAQYYIRTRPHLIPKDVEIWESSENGSKFARLL